VGVGVGPLCGATLAVPPLPEHAVSAAVPYTANSKKCRDVMRMLQSSLIRG
jgi:hypothetical protein